MNARSVAIIGGGPAGLVAARYLAGEGFATTIFDAGARIGGQWSGDPRVSGVWPSMRTNTSRAMTVFSDLSYPAGTATYPTNQEVGAYLLRYAERFGLLPGVRPGTVVHRIAPLGGSGEANEGWIVRHAGPDGAPHDECFSHVVVAAGRYQTPCMPAVPGLESFSGSGGASHTFDYTDPDRYRGLRVLVAGCAISALEIASDLAMLGAARVVTTNRRQRYVLPKLAAGVPTDHLAFTRFAALAGEVFPAEVTAAGLKQLVLRTGGNPEDYGAPRPAESVAEAGITLSQHYLPLVAEGRIGIKPWVERVRGEAVRFSDGSEESFDAIVFGTGYALSLPFLGDDVRQSVGADRGRLDLYGLTFHPELPRFACIGLFHQVGPYFPVLELQARWIAYGWSGRRPMPSRAEMATAMAAAPPPTSTPIVMHNSALLFARAAGVEPDLAAWPELARALLFGPLTSISFRLSGPDALPEAAGEVARAAAAWGAGPSLELTPEHRAQLVALAEARNDPAFTAFVQEVLVRSRRVPEPLSRG